ncbi:MAG: hypothetical protein Pars2KO_16370 [Parasphingorhabdus sp.]
MALRSPFLLFLHVQNKLTTLPLLLSVLLKMPHVLLAKLLVPLNVLLVMPHVPLLVLLKVLHVPLVMPHVPLLVLPVTLLAPLQTLLALLLSNSLVHSIGKCVRKAV